MYSPLAATPPPSPSPSPSISNPLGRILDALPEIVVWEWVLVLIVFGLGGYFYVSSIFRRRAERKSADGLTEDELRAERNRFFRAAIKCGVRDGVTRKRLRKEVSQPNDALFERTLNFWIDEGCFILTPHEANSRVVDGKTKVTSANRMKDHIRLSSSGDRTLRMVKGPIYEAYRPATGNVYQGPVFHGDHEGPVIDSGGGDVRVRDNHSDKSRNRNSRNRDESRRSVRAPIQITNVRDSTFQLIEAVHRAMDTDTRLNQQDRDDLNDAIVDLKSDPSSNRYRRAIQTILDKAADSAGSEMGKTVWLGVTGIGTALWSHVQSRS